MTTGHAGGGVVIGPASLYLDDDGPRRGARSMLP
jgi:hypothetical protein